MNFTLHQSMHEANVLRCPNNLIKLMQCLNSLLVRPDLMRTTKKSKDLKSYCPCINEGQLL